ncbi:LPXTG cell wall anchor domain-containing protein [Lactiplantibacillus garii]|uniref:LPXTG cell wall anchor domain-containing protein n=1 Tax=Lactiplantibacillus garii TaxID=2306423 RepID=A0A3R8QT73_9LACO|nr:MucBP domain-containing protein [Lactiplantibacillus garii]RRK11587.1 LPXTG cell wall anchor domain-containing protein [Lactiplantibacillus garii]
MRLTKLQEIQKITKQNRRQQFKRTWKTTLVLLGSSVGLGTALWTLPAAAATTPPATTPQSATSTVTTSAATSGGSMAMSATNSTSSTASAATSTAVMSATTSSTSATTSTASTATSMPATSAANSMTSSATTSTASNATSTSTSAGAGFTLPPLPTSVSTSLATSSAAMTSTASQTSSSASQATTSVASPATSAALPDSTIVTFADPGIEANVLSDMNIVGPITLGNIRNYSGTRLDIGTTGVPLEITSTLAGMQYLQYLPAKTLINFYTSYPDANVDLTPLENDRFDQLSIMDHDLGAVNLAPLTKIDPTTISTVQLVGSVEPGMTDYQQNAFGMNNAQLAELGSWLTAIDNTSTAPDGFLDFNFSDNSLTDFSPVSGFTKAALFTALGQRVNYGATPVNMVIGQPATFTALPLTGMNGESLTSHYQVTLSGSPTVSAATADTTHPAEPFLTNLGNGQFEIATAYPTITGATWFAYGLQGYYQLTQASQMDTNFIHIDYPNGVTFEYDVMVYQPANWLPAPELNVNFVDGTTKQPIEPAELVKGTTIGSSYDLTPQTEITGYIFQPEQSSSTSGTYTQDPQALTFTFVRQPSGGIVVNYVDENNEPIASGVAINGYVGDAYQTAPVTVPGYTLTTETIPGSAPTSGTLPVAAGTVNYVYAPNQLTRTIHYVDVTTGKDLLDTELVSPYQSDNNYDPTTTIDNYEHQGYQLVSDNYPTWGSMLFDDPTPSATYEIELAHQMVTLTPASSALPADVDLTQQTSRTIEYQSTTGTTLAAPTIQTLHYTRTAAKDMVTGEITYGPWVGDDADTFSAVIVPTVRSYQPDMATVPAVTDVAAGTPNQVVTVTYDAVAPATSAATGSSSQPASSVPASATAASSATTKPTATPAAPTNTVAVTPTVTLSKTTSSAATPVTTPTVMATMTPVKPTTEKSPAPTTPTVVTTNTVSGVRPIMTGVTTAKSLRNALTTTTSAQPIVAGAAHVAMTPLTTKAVSATPTESATPLPSRSAARGLPQTSERTSAASLLGLLLLGLVAGFARIKRFFKRIF